MKNRIQIISVLSLMGLLLLGCKKDDKTTTGNYLKIGDTQYKLSAGILNNFGTDGDNSWYYGYNTDLVLYSDGFSLIESDGDWELVGKGHGIYFEMFSTTGESLDNGDYIFSSTEPYAIKTFDYGNYVVNYDSEIEDKESVEGYKEADIKSGKVTISKKGNEYSITINCLSQTGDKITGFYKGTLQYMDSSDDYLTAGLKSGKVKMTFDYQKR